MNTKLDSTVPGPTPQDVQRLLGDLEASTVTAILQLAPTLAEIEEAALWAAGEGETLKERHQPRIVMQTILELIAADDDGEQRER